MKKVVKQKNNVYDIGHSSWNKSGSGGSGSSYNNNNNNNNGKGVSEKMWKDLTEKMAKLDIEIDYRKK